MDNINLVKRSGIVAFYRLPDGETYTRMKGFTGLSVSKSPEEYNRKYIDENSKRTDVVGYDTSMSFEFDYQRDNDVHSDIVSIIDEEKIGADAVRDIVVVDMETKKAKKRSYAVIADSEGDDENIYTYSGSFKANGELVFGTAAISDDGMSATFTEAAE